MKADCLPFSQIPHTTRLFTDFLSYAPAVRAFYPRSPHLSEWLRSETGKVSYDASRRERVAGILERQNKSWDASQKTLANLERLRCGAAAVVTGQQVGLFGGPVFAIYKALTAVKLTEEATAAGVDAVPVFWLATYDHDLAEVNHVALPGPEGLLQTLTASSRGVTGGPVSAVHLGEEILPVVEQAASLLGDTEATTILRDSYRPGETLGTAFARLFTKVFAEWGVIVLDASDGELHRVAEPIYCAAVERAGELAAALIARGEALDAAGYHQQVKVAPSSVLVFTLRDGARTAIHHHDGREHEFAIGGDDDAEKISRAELLKRVQAAPEQFSPNVLLRPVVQDYLLPTLVYTGGAAEAAYFAQAGAVYEALAGRVTPIVPRYSATIVEAKMQRLLEKHGIRLTDVFSGPEGLRRKLAANSLPSDLQAAFESAKKSLDASLAAIQEKLAKLDRTLVDAAETSRSKMQHQFEKIYSQAARAELQKSELVARHADLLSQALYPEKGLQERGIGGMYFVAKYGREFLRQIYDSMRSDCHDHQIVEL
ncbi:MAG TPA: bacillithiol biosynthesis cysteine-adding enzyme BshC [Verrucomicrobiae bacterium]|nr:bacillithiol biosynthesis cysteine-adding enzyme BshC [Verrucomicrobiae bacterium]